MAKKKIKRLDVFMSSARLDEELSGRYLSLIRNNIEREIKSKIGNDRLIINRDIDGINLAENWLEIRKNVCFLIPIVSPSYLASYPCLIALAKFYGYEQMVGIGNLILPVEFKSVTGLLTYPNPFADILGKRYSADLRDLWHEGSEHPNVHREIIGLAQVITEVYAYSLLKGLPAVDSSFSSAVRQPEPKRIPRQKAVRPVITHEFDKSYLWKNGTVFRDIYEHWCPELVALPAGSFLMGSPLDEEERDDNEGPQHKVTISYPFALGRYTVTFEEYDHFCERTQREKPTDRHWGRHRRPVVNVSWEDAQAYCAWLSGETGKLYRLPSEAEWEYACRAGTATPFWTGATISTWQANYDGAYIYGSGRKGVCRKRTVPVDDPGFPANPFGLYHMHGNVWEWVEDCWHNSYENAPVDGSTWTEGYEIPLRRILRGGSWFVNPGFLRSAFRLSFGSEDRYFNAGFRVARALAP